MPPTFTAKLRSRYSLVTERATHQVDDRRGVEDGVDSGDGRGHVVGVGDIADDGLQPGVLGERRGARSKERTSCPRSSSSVTRLAPTKPEPPVTRMRPSSVVSDASPMRGSPWTLCAGVWIVTSITETCSSFDTCRVGGPIRLGGAVFGVVGGQRILDPLAGSG